MTPSAWFTLGLLIVMLAGLIRFAHLADAIFMGGLAVLGLAGILTPQDALAGFSNSGLITVAALFVVAAGMRETGALHAFSHHILGREGDGRRVLFRLCSIIAAISAFLNNTTIVAMATPAVVDWCRRHRYSASRLLLPLDYATIAGGMCTLIGTSTTLVVHGLLIGSGLKGFGFLELAAVGIPLTVATIVYLLVAGPRLLPERQELLSRLDASRREFLVEMAVETDCPLIGQTLAQAGLRHLPGLFLVDITRGDQVIAPVTPDERLHSGDRLGFAGVVDTIIDLQKTRGLVPVPPDAAGSELAAGKRRNLAEAVISANSPLVGRGIRESNFRTVYDAAVIAVHRSGERMAGKIGDIVLRAGDTLLLQTSTGFVRAHRNNPDFYLVSDVSDAEPIRHHRIRHAVLILGALVLLMMAPDIVSWLGWTHRRFKMLEQGQALFAIGAAVAMVVARCISGSTARRSIQWDTLFVIGASFGIARAMEKTGLAAMLVEWCMPLMNRGGAIMALAMVYVLTNVLTELLTNNAAAALIFPIALSAATQMGAEARPFAVAVAVAASGGFVIPIGYQTHMMVFGPGGYKLSDFVRLGLPLNIIWFAVTMMVVPMVWPLGR